MKFALSPLPCSSPSAESRTCYFCSFFFFFFFKYNGQKKKLLFHNNYRVETFM